MDGEICKASRKKYALSAVFALCAAIGWWGAVYPQFTLVEGTCRMVCEEDGGMEEQTGEDAVCSGLYWKLLKTDRSQIRFRSRLLMELKTLQGQFAEAKEKDL